MHMGLKVLKATLATEIDGQEGVKSMFAGGVDVALWNAALEMSRSSWLIKALLFQLFFIFFLHQTLLASNEYEF